MLQPFAMHSLIADRIGGKIECQATTPSPHSPLMAAVQYIVEGEATLSGTIRPSGNKNAALPIIAASLLSEHPIVLENVPRIRDTETLVELINSVGASAVWTDRNSLSIHAKDCRPRISIPNCAEDSRVDPAGRSAARALRRDHAPATRRRCHRSPAARHALSRARAARREVTANDKLLRLRAKALVGADVFLDEPSVTATENALVAALRRTRHDHSSQCRLRAARAGSRALPLHARREDRWDRNELRHDRRRPTARRRITHRIGPDHIEVGSFIGLAAVTRSRDSHRAGGRRASPFDAAWDSRDLGIVCRGRRR